MMRTPERDQYRSLNNYQYYFGGLLSMNPTVREPQNPILIIKAPAVILLFFGDTAARGAPRSPRPRIETAPRHGAQRAQYPFFCKEDTLKFI